MSGFKKGDKVEILIGGSDSSKFGMTREMTAAKGEIGIVHRVGDAPRSPIAVRHPSFPYSYNYSAKELRKVEPELKIEPEFLPGQRVKILKGGAYGSNSMMDQAEGEYGIVRSVEPDSLDRKRQQIRVETEGGHGTWSYAPHELQHETVVKLRGFTADTVIIDDPAVEHIQSHDELVAENESLEKQIRKLEARVERKKEFQRQNVRKIAAWQVILEE